MGQVHVRRLYLEKEKEPRLEDLPPGVPWHPWPKRTYHRKVREPHYPLCSLLVHVRNIIVILEWGSYPLKFIKKEDARAYLE